MSSTLLQLRLGFSPSGRSSTTSLKLQTVSKFGPNRTSLALKAPQVLNDNAFLFFDTFSSAGLPQFSLVFESARCLNLLGMLFALGSAWLGDSLIRITLGT